MVQYVLAFISFFYELFILRKASNYEGGFGPRFPAVFYYTLKFVACSCSEADTSRRQTNS
jgi:hypothetical protein